MKKITINKSRLPLNDNEINVVVFDDVEICILKKSNKYFAFDNLCPHKKLPLNGGEISENFIICPFHQWKFDITTGLSNIADQCINVYNLDII